MQQASPPLAHILSSPARRHNTQVHYQVSPPMSCNSRLLELPAETYENIAGFLRYKDLVCVSLTCTQLRQAYFVIQRRLKVLKAKNVSSRRRRLAYTQQLKACQGLEVLNFVNFPSSMSLFVQIESMKELRELDLSGCGLQGTIPSCVENLKHLEVLALANNQFTGPLPDLGQLFSLRIIRLSFNKLEGPIPNSWENLTNLTQISMSYNKLSGVIPDFFGTFTKLESLLLGSNKLTGPIPASLGRLESLKDLFLFENCLEGDVPEELFTGCHSLQKMYLSLNKLQGKLPDSLGQLGNLKELIISSNAGMNGTLPESLTHLKCIKTVDLSDTNISTDRHVVGQLRNRQCDVIV